MQLLADVAGHGFELPLWDLLWPVLGARQCGIHTHVACQAVTQLPPNNGCASYAHRPAT
jgi:hypothetical protein